jgi:hypothetical protein
MEEAREHMQMKDKIMRMMEDKRMWEIEGQRM